MPRVGHFWLRLLLFAGVAALSGCTKGNDDERVFTVRGTIRGAFDETDRTISIEHEAIPGYMPAMTMPFYTSATDVAGLVPGDRVEFEFHVGDSSRATKFRKLGRDSADARSESRATGGTSAARTARLREGDVVPAFSLIDQDGGSFGADQLRGRHTVLTFVFTRCPVPEFCPLIGRKFQALQRALREAPGLPTSGVQLLSITIDPQHDRPEVLRTYGDALGADFGRWRFLTGDESEIAKLAKLFAVRTEWNGATIDHTLATALVDPRGKVAAIWRGNAWTTEEVLEALKSAPAQRE